MKKTTQPTNAVYNEEDAYRRRKVAVLGGTFDPIHKGHIALAKTVLERGLAHEVVFVPAAKPPHKLNKPITPAKQRLAMLEIALAGEANMSISDVEIMSGRKTSYTYNTLETLSLVYPGKELCLIIGMDNMLTLDTWYQWRDLIRRYNFIIFERPGTKKLTYADAADQFGAHVTQKLLDSVVNDLQMDISATEIRQALDNKRDVSHAVTSETLKYIEENKIYG